MPPSPEGKAFFYFHEILDFFDSLGRSMLRPYLLKTDIFNLWGEKGNAGDDDESNDNRQAG